MPLILIADDNSENRYLLDVILQKNGFDTVIVTNGEEALKTARMTRPDLIISDILMPVMDGFTLCRQWKADDQLKGIPFVFYTATYIDTKDIELGLSLGADRFLIKPQEIDALLQVLREVLTEKRVEWQTMPERSFEEEMGVLSRYNEALFRKLEKKMADLEESNRALRAEIERRQQVENNLRESEDRLKTLFDTLPVGLVSADAGGRIQYVNGKFTELFGYTTADIPTINDWFALASPDQSIRERIFSLWRKSIESAGQIGAATSSFDFRITCKDGSFRDVSVIGTVIRRLHIAIFTDITEEKKLREQLLQAQKLESIGNLAGGIAHDFNNILTTVTGFAGLLQMRMQKSDPLMPYVNELASAGMRGAALTHQLLAFSRKQILDIRAIDLNKAMADLKKMLQRLIREDIVLSFMPCEDPLPVMADVNQIGQVVINLVTNARDAMPDGGPLTISTGVAEIDDSFIRRHGYGELGRYAAITISDKGTGMGEETKAKIFEPFYTTKEIGKGTGLGLAVVYGIIRQHKGMVYVESEPGKGTTFNVCLPLLNTGIDMEKRPGEDAIIRGGSETILVAEDDEMIRTMTGDILRSQGYKVLIAEDGEAAVALIKERPKEIDLVVLDVIMPGKRGLEAYAEIIKEAPGVKALFVTGYSESEVERNELRWRELPLLLKPYRPMDFLIKVRELLDGKTGP